MVVRAAKMTEKYRMTPTSASIWVRLKFEGDTMGVAVGRVAEISGGTGGSITVTPRNGGSRVNVIWDHDSKSCAEATTHFWQNLDRLLTPGGFKFGPRSAALNVATVLYFITAAVCLVDGIAAYLEGLDTYIVASMGWTSVMFIYAIYEGMLSLRQRRYIHALVMAGVLELVYGMGLAVIVVLGLSFLLPYQLIMLALTTTAAVCIWKSKDDFET